MLEALGNGSAAVGQRPAAATATARLPSRRPPSPRTAARRQGANGAARTDARGSPATAGDRPSAPRCGAAGEPPTGGRAGRGAGAGRAAGGRHPAVERVRPTRDSRTGERAPGAARREGAGGW